MDKILPEILDIIFSNLNCKSIILIGRVCKKFNIRAILDKKKYHGFPRKEGRCVLHINESLLHMISDPNINSIASNYVYDNDMDLVRGDLYLITGPCEKRYVRYDSNYKLAIFDGLKLIGMENDGNRIINTLLPREFCVIENNVPIKYWVNDQLQKWAIFNIYSVWFDHSLVKDQCLNNIKYDILFDSSTKYGVYTCFKYNNNDYYIICDYSDYVFHDYNQSEETVNFDDFKIKNDNTKLHIINKFKKKLSHDNVKFKTYEIITDNKNTLIIQIH